MNVEDDTPRYFRPVERHTDRCEKPRDHALKIRVQAGKLSRQFMLIFAEDGPDEGPRTEESNSDPSRGPVPERHRPDIPEIPDISQGFPGMTLGDMPGEVSAAVTGGLEPAVHCPSCGALTAPGQAREHRAGWIRCQGCGHEWLPAGEGEWEIVL